MRWLLVLGAVAIAWSTWAAETRPFTLGAEVATALALGAFVVLLAATVVPQWRRASAPSQPLAGDAPGVAGTPERVGLAAWGLFAVAVIAFELANYLLLPRHAHPTISSALTVLADHAWSRGLCFFAWLALGARLARR